MQTWAAMVRLSARFRREPDAWPRSTRGLVCPRRIPQRLSGGLTTEATIAPLWASYSCVIRSTRQEKFPRIVGNSWIAVLLLCLAAIAATSFARAGGFGSTPGSSYPEAVGNIGGKFLFGAQDPHGQGLWRTDGTAAGTSTLPMGPRLPS